MDITIHDETEKRFVFEDMKPGEVFKYHGHEYMALKTRYDDESSAINLDGKEWIFIQPKEHVQPKTEKRVFITVGELKSRDLFLLFPSIYRVSRVELRMGYLTVKDIFSGDTACFHATKIVTPITHLEIIVNGGK